MSVYLKLEEAGLTYGTEEWKEKQEEKYMNLFKEDADAGRESTAGQAL